MKVFFVAKLNLPDWFFHIYNEDVEILSDSNVRLFLLENDESKGIVCKAYSEIEVDCEIYDFI